MNRILPNINKYLTFLIFIPIIIFYGYLATYGMNLPHWDDYEIIDFVNKFFSQKTAVSKLKVMYEQHNEHRIVYTNVVSLLTYFFTGKINFSIMMWVGSLSILGIQYLFYRVIKLNNLPIIYLLPVTFTLFQLATFENTYWGMAAVQNFTVVVFMVASIWQISNNKIPYFWMFMAVITSGNPVVLLPAIGLIIFILKKDFKNAAIFTAYSIALFILYFTTYVKPPLSKYANSDNKLDYIHGFFCFLGSTVDVNLWGYNYTMRIQNATIFGIIIFVTTLYFAINFLIKQFNKSKATGNNLTIIKENNQYFLFGILGIAIFTGCILSVTRLNFGLNIFLIGRYRIYSLLAFCALYLICLINIKGKFQNWLFGITSLFALFIYANSYYYCHYDIVNYRKYEIANYYNYWHSNKGNINNVANGKYDYLNTYFDTIQVQKADLNRYQLKIIENKEELHIENENYEMGNNKDDGIYLEFTSNKEKLIFSTKQNTPNSKKLFYTNFAPNAKGFKVKLNHWDLPVNNYLINIIEKKGNNLIYYKTEKTVTYLAK